MGTFRAFEEIEAWGKARELSKYRELGTRDPEPGTRNS
jgi:hypothetical protein